MLFRHEKNNQNTSVFKYSLCYFVHQKKEMIFRSYIKIKKIIKIKFCFFFPSYFLSLSNKTICFVI